MSLNASFFSNEWDFYLMIQINGDYNEGGGQILRTALSLSAVTGKSFKVTKIRAKRKKPGLKEQHLQAVNSVAMLCNAKHNAKLFSQELKFEPGKLIHKKTLNVKVRTAGATALIISTVLPIAYRIEKSLTLTIDGGGTWNIFAPSVLYLQEVLLPLLKKAGVNAKINIKKDGFYPKGGAQVELSIEPWRIQKKLDLTKYDVKKAKIFSIATAHLKSREVAERQSYTVLK